jgi:hypothetical protein
MKGAAYAKRGTAFGRPGHQQVAPTGENPVWPAYIALEEQQECKLCLSA